MQQDHVKFLGILLLVLGAGLFCGCQDSSSTHENKIQTDLNALAESEVSDEEIVDASAIYIEEAHSLKPNIEEGFKKYVISLEKRIDSATNPLHVRRPIDAQVLLPNPLTVTGMDVVPYIRQEIRQTKYPLIRAQLINELYYTIIRGGKESSYSESDRKLIKEINQEMLEMYETEQSELVKDLIHDWVIGWK